MLHSFRVQPAGRLVRDCGIRRYGTGPAFSRPQPARDGTAWTRKMLSPRRVGTGRDGPTCLTFLDPNDYLKTYKVKYVFFKELISNLCVSYEI